MWPRGEENVRHNPLRSKAILSDLAGADAPLGRRAFLTLGAVLTGGLALGGKPPMANPVQEGGQGEETAHPADDRV